MLIAQLHAIVNKPSSKAWKWMGKMVPDVRGEVVAASLLLQYHSENPLQKTIHSPPFLALMPQSLKFGYCRHRLPSCHWRQRHCRKYLLKDTQTFALTLREVGLRV